MLYTNQNWVEGALTENLEDDLLDLTNRLKDLLTQRTKYQSYKNLIKITALKNNCSWVPD